MMLFAGSVYSGSKALANLVLFLMAMLVNLSHVLKKKIKNKKGREMIFYNYTDSAMFLFLF